MAFKPVLFLVVGHFARGRAVIRHCNSVALSFEGLSLDADGPIGVSNAATASLPYFVLSEGVKTGTLIRAELSFDRAALAGVAPAIQQQLIEGKRVSLPVSISGVTGNQILVIEFRALKSTELLITSADGVVQAEPQYPVGVSGPNIGLPLGDDASNYKFTTPLASELGSGVLTQDIDGNILVSAGAPPSLQSNRAFLVHATSVPSADANGVPVTVSATAMFTCNIHLSTEVVVLLDRSGSMSRNCTATQTKWEAARAACNLFSELYCAAVPEWLGASAALLDSKMIAVERFAFGGGFMADFTPERGTALAASRPQLLSPEIASGGTPLGEALVSAASRLTSGIWRKRHIILLTDGTTNCGTPAFSVPIPGIAMLATDPVDGVAIHCISYAQPGETALATLDSLRAHYNGLLLGSESDERPLDPDKLRERFIDLLSQIIPINRVGSFEAANSSVRIDPGVDRAIFLTCGVSTLSASNEEQTTLPELSGTGTDYAFAGVDGPNPGTWSLTHAGCAVVDLALFMHCEVSSHGLGKAIQLRATLDAHGQAVSGARIVVKVRRPGESIGEVITTFARTGGVFKLLSQVHVPKAAVATSSQLSTQLANRLSSVPAALAAAGFDAHGTGDTLSMQRILLEAAEYARGATLLIARDDVTLTETSPGVYTGDLGAAFTQEEGLYSFDFHAEGATSEAAGFVRDQSRCAVLIPTPAPMHSKLSVTSSVLCDQRVAYCVHIFPRTDTHRAVGPGAGYLFDLVWRKAENTARFGAPVLIDNLDGSYSANIVLPPEQKLPALLLAPSNQVPGSDPRGGIDIINNQVCWVKVILDKIRIIDDHESWLFGSGEIAFDVLAGPNGIPARSVRTRLPEKGAFAASSGDTIIIHKVVYEGFIEGSARLHVMVGGKEFDSFLVFTREEPLARYHRSFAVVPGVRMFEPENEPNDPENLRDWQLWYHVEVTPA